MTHEYSQGVCGDGCAILRDGVMMTVDDIVDTLNAYQSEIAKLRRGVAASAYAEWVSNRRGEVWTDGDFRERWRSAAGRGAGALTRIPFASATH